MARNHKRMMHLRMHSRERYYYEIDWNNFLRLHEYRARTGMPLRQILRQAIRQWLMFHPVPTTEQTPVEQRTMLVQ